MPSLARAKYSKMNKFSITFRPHINDNIIFEEVFPYIISSLNKAPQYFYTVEKDDTMDRHLHAYIETTQRSDNFFRNLKKILYDRFDASNTKMSIAWRCHKVDDDHDKYMVLGYQQKEENYKRRDTNIDETILIDTKNYYEENKPPEIKTTKYKFIEMNKNNIKNYILEFCEKNDEKIDSTILRKMLKKGYCNSNIPQRSLRRIILECKVLLDQKLDTDEEHEYDKPIDWSIDENYENLNMRQDLRQIHKLIKNNENEKILKLTQKYT